MLRTKPIFLTVIILLIVSLACVLPSVVSTPDSNMIGTAIAQTMAAVAGQTQFAPSMVPIIQVSDTPIFTFTPEPPTVTPTITLTSTPVFTSTPLIPLISVSTPTNCRVGPGKVYDRVGALLVGEVAEVIGRDLTGNYWYIRNPDGGTEFCWLWGEYATLSGNFAVLPMFTPPPTPTPAPDFEASYRGLDTCVGWWVDINLKNTGGVNFRSVSLTLRDTTNDTVLSLYTDGFTDNSGCLDSVNRSNLQPGEVRTMSSPAFGYDPTGHKLRATITVCSNIGQSGTCVTDVITFTP
jgi:hypothetical protein